MNVRDECSPKYVGLSATEIEPVSALVRLDSAPVTVPATVTTPLPKLVRAVTVPLDVAVFVRALEMELEQDATEPVQLLVAATAPLTDDVIDDSAPVSVAVGLGAETGKAPAFDVGVPTTVGLCEFPLVSVVEPPSSGSHI